MNAKVRACAALAFAMLDGCTSTAAYRERMALPPCAGNTVDILMIRAP
jgi:uncharacterized lipoprotein YbaY